MKQEFYRRNYDLWFEYSSLCLKHLHVYFVTAVTRTNANSSVLNENSGTASLAYIAF
jgi:hypothetical protein